jgi:hypothetical protein
MTEPAIPDSFRTTGYNPAHRGCSADGCGSQNAVVMCPRFGRRCAEHVPPFDPTHAATLATTDLGAAIDYIRGSGGLG